MKINLVFGAIALTLLCSISKLNTPVFSALTTSQQPEPPTCIDCLFDNLPSNLSWRLTIPDDSVKGQRIRISSTVFQSDGKTPAAGVLLYCYHTNANGRYAKSGVEVKYSQSWWHGYLHGWLKTDRQGRYEINTIKPAPYPQKDIPAHIHVALKAPTQQKAYWINDFVFQNDPLLTDTYWYRLEQSDGLLRYDGIALKVSANGKLQGKRDITLYPQFDRDGRQSGLAIGENCPAFDPVHVWGADAGTRTCPMCKYGSHTTGVMAWLPAVDQGKADQLAVFLEKQMQQRGKPRFKAFLIYTNPDQKPAQQVDQLLTDFARRNGLRNVALLYVPSPSDKRTSFLYQINPLAQNTIMIYSQRRVVNKFVNLSVTPTSLTNVAKTIETAMASSTRP